MRKFLCILACLSFIFSLSFPVMAADLDGGYYFVADSALGSGKKFYIPADFSDGSLTYNDSGYLFNLTSSTIYLYCPDYPDYTITASRFSTFQYRQGTSGYQYTDLQLRNISDTNVEIYDSDPTILPADSKLQLLIVCLLVVIVGVLVILRR